MSVNLSECNIVVFPVSSGRKVESGCVELELAGDEKGLKLMSFRLCRLIGIDVQTDESKILPQTSLIVDSLGHRIHLNCFTPPELHSLSDLSAKTASRGVALTANIFSRWS